MPQDICRLYQVCCFYENLNNWSEISYYAVGYYYIYTNTGVGKRDRNPRRPGFWNLLSTI